MAQSVTDTSFGGGVRVGPNFESSPQTRRVSAFWKMGAGMSLAPIYPYIFTPFPATNTAGSPAYDVTTLQQNITNGAGISASGYFTLSNADWPTSYQYTDPITNQTTLQFDVPRCLRISWGGGNMTGNLTINVWGSDFYGQRMMEKFVIPEGSVTPTYLMRKAFFKVTNAWYNFAANATAATIEVALSTSNSFGLPYRLYGAGDVISAGGGAQVLSQSPSSDPIDGGLGTLTSQDPKLVTSPNLTTNINAAVTQGFFENQLPTYNQTSATAADLYQTGGPVHVAEGRDVRGIVAAGPSITAGPSLGIMTLLPVPATPITVSFSYLVKGFANDLSNEYYQRVDSAGNIVPRPGYAAGQVPYPILPNVYFNYPAGVYVPATGTADIQRLPLTLNDAMGVEQFYSENPIV